MATAKATIGLPRASEEKDLLLASVRPESFTAVNGLSRQLLPGLAKQVLRWDFNVFAFAEEAKGRPLTLLTLSLLEHYGILDGWQLQRQTAEAYLTAVEHAYKANPYHNSTHAADVTQTAGVILASFDARLKAAGQPGVPREEAFAVLLGAAVHDLGHPGVNNSFLVRTRDAAALNYNDRSVNEMMHAACAFKLAWDNPRLNVFAGLSGAQYETVRRLVVDMVLSTDMDVHFTLLQRFQTALEADPDITTWSSLEQRSLVYQMLLHLADLANPSRPWHLALGWAERVVSEFLLQGQREAAAGVDVSDFCNATKVCMPVAQLFFIERFMAPTLEAFAPAAPSFYAMAAPWLEDTRAKWAVFRDAGVKLPHQAYPALPDTPRLPAVLGGSECCDAEQQTAAAAVHACHSKPAPPQQRCSPQPQQPQQQPAGS